MLISTVVGVVMALSGYGYWALVGMAVSLPAVNLVSLWIAVPWRPGLPRRRQGLRSMFHLGGTWTFVGVASYASYNLEKVLLGRYFGAVPLGLYGRAYQIVSLPTELMTSIGTVAISALSRLQQDPDKLRRAFVDCYTLIVSATIPVTFLTAVSAPEIVAVVLGPQWNESSAILRALAPTTLAFALMYPYAWFLASTARNRVSIGTTLLVPPFVISGIVLGLPYGPVGVAMGYSAGVVLLAVPVVIWCGSATGIPARTLWDAIRRPLCAGLGAAGCTLGVKAALQGALPPLMGLTVQAGVLFAVYAWLLLTIFERKTYYVDLVMAVLSRSRSGRVPAHDDPPAEPAGVVGR